MFDISIVVPVYNKEKYIADCIKSLVQQKTKKNIEIICINDGSKDNSLEVLKELQKLNSNIRIVDKKNGGVSSARNYGLKAATGRYVLFLDADDYLSENTVEDIVNFFDQNSNSIDLVTYNIYYERKGKSVKGKRGSVYKNNCIIDLNNEPDFSQTTMNVCVKNGLNIYFDENIELGEDQLFNTTILSKKKKIGWCNTAKYFYRRDASSTGLINHPYFAAESIKYFFKRLLELGESEQFDSYCKSLILYNFSWRISGDYLFEYHLTDGKAVLSESLTEVLNKIDSDLIIKNRWLIRDHKHFLLSLKSRNKPFVIKEEDGLYLCDSLHGEFAKEKRITIVFQREKIHNNKLYLMGFLKSDCLNYCGKPELYVEKNGQKVKISLYESSNSYFGSPIKTNKYWGFELNINIEKATNIKFFAKIDGYFYPTGFWFRPWSAISTDNKVFIHEGEKFVIEVKDDTILCKPVLSKQKTVSKKIEAELKKNDKGRLFIRKVSQALKERFNIQLYIDARDYLDNAFIQFKYDITKKDKSLRFYVYSSEKDKDTIKRDLGWFRSLFLVKKDSLLHRILFVASKRIYTSFFERSMFVPYVKSYKYYADIIDFECIYLQHGVIHAKLDNMYSKDCSNFVDKIVVSTHFEAIAAKNNLHFRDEDILKTGMPRFEILGKNKRKENSNRILYAPSWRKYMLEHLGPDNWESRSVGEKDSFIQEMKNFLSNKNLHEFLETKNLFLDIKLHRNFSCYSGLFNKLHPRIQTIDKANPHEYLIAISDISSYMFDFVFYGIPIVRFIPDLEKIKAGLHSYREFYCPEDKVGVLCLNPESALENIKEIYKTGCKANYDRNALLIENINNSCENIYEALN